MANNSHPKNNNSTTDIGEFLFSLNAKLMLEEIAAERAFDEIHEALQQRIFSRTAIPHRFLSSNPGSSEFVARLFEKRWRKRVGGC